MRTPEARAARGRALRRFDDPVHGPEAPARQAGFTLVEVVVALGVFSIAVLALLHATGEQARAFTMVEEATMARFVADNQMAVAMADPRAIQLGSANGVETQVERDWGWRRTTTATQDPYIVRITVSVSAEGEEQVLAEAVAFRSTRGTGVGAGAAGNTNSDGQGEDE